MSNAKFTTHLSIFTQAVDENYSNNRGSTQDSDYYSYDGFNIDEIDKILDKSRLTAHDDDLDDKSTGFVSDEEILKGIEDIQLAQSAHPNKKISSLFADNWSNNLIALKNQTLVKLCCAQYFQGKLKNCRKLTYDSMSSYKLEN